MTSSNIVLPRSGGKHLSKVSSLAQRELNSEQSKLARARERFDAIADLELAEDLPIMPFDRVQGRETPLANLTIRESLGNEF